VSEDIKRLLAFFAYDEADRWLLAGLRPLLEKHADSLVSAFYRHLLSFPETQELLRNPQVRDRPHLENHPEPAQHGAAEPTTDPRPAELGAVTR